MELYCYTQLIQDKICRRKYILPDATEKTRLGTLNLVNFMSSREILTLYVSDVIE